MYLAPKQILTRIRKHANNTRLSPPIFPCLVIGWKSLHVADWLKKAEKSIIVIAVLCKITAHFKRIYYKAQIITVYSVEVYNFYRKG